MRHIEKNIIPVIERDCLCCQNSNLKSKRQKHQSLDAYIQSIDLI
jgi:hypothetical protein